MWDPTTCSRPSSCSTPSHQPSWSEVVTCGRAGHSDGATSPPGLVLSNYYIIYGHHRATALTLQRQPASTLADTPDARRSSRVMFAMPHPTSHRTPPSLSIPLDTLAVCSIAPTPSHFTTVIVGDSIVRNVMMKLAKTCSFPDAKVQEITSKIPEILHKHPELERLVVHVGTNDVPKQCLNY